MGVVYKVIEDCLDPTVELKLPGGEKQPGFHCAPGHGRVYTAKRRESQGEYWLKRMGLSL
jgi:hypothetical protein